VTNAADLYPQHRTDFERLEKLLKLERSEVDPQLGALLHWLEDRNYPIAGPIADYLVSRGEAVVPHVREALKSRDWWWQYNILLCVVGRWPRELVMEIRPELEQLVPSSQVDEADVVALRILATHNISSPEFLEKWVKFKLVGARGILKELEEIEQLVRRDV
jgi:Domain of unknown function (DUF5071)